LQRKPTATADPKPYLIGSRAHAGLVVERICFTIPLTSLRRGWPLEFVAIFVPARNRLQEKPFIFSKRLS